MSILSEIGSVFHHVIVGAENAEQKVKLIIGKFEVWVESNPALEGDLKLFFGAALAEVEKGVPALESAIADAAKAPGASLESIWSAAHNGLFGLLGRAASTVKGQVSNPANAITVALTVGQIIASAVANAAAKAALPG